MGIVWDRVFEHERRQFEEMSEPDKFVYFLLLQFGSPYG
jgi:murein DD-endopeptidase